MPEHVRQHVDYITPGIKLFAGGSASKSKLDKRTFGINSRRNARLPPLKAPLPVSISSILAAPELALCDVAITP